MWQPTARLEILHLRAQLYKNIRDFFEARQILEVQTPILSAGAVPEPAIEPLFTECHLPDSKRFFLQTSPELPMKRLLAAGSGAIYQIAKVFRDGEVGNLHNPEFTMLEWYRPNFNQYDLIQEVSEFLQAMLECEPAECLNYCEVFEKYSNLHPLHSALSDLQNHTAKLGMYNAQILDRDSCLQFIMSAQIERQLGLNRPTVVAANFPATQAALAKKCEDNPALAERFEVYFKGVELANGFYELTDSIEQYQRFEADLAKRKTLNLPTHPLDKRFLAALESGLPECAGVAIGLDRLLMLIAKVPKIQDVLTFSIDYA